MAAAFLLLTETYAKLSQCHSVKEMGTTGSWLPRQGELQPLPLPAVRLLIFFKLALFMDLLSQYG